MSITRSVTTFPLQLKMILETSWVLKGLQEILTNFFLMTPHMKIRIHLKYKLTYWQFYNKEKLQRWCEWLVI